MSPKIDPQEIYMLERYSSLDYFGEMRDTWAEMVKHVESCLQTFMNELPSRYRSRPLPEQPDAVWGERVLPNFRYTLQGLNNGFIELAHGDAGGLEYASGVRGDFKGQLDCWPGWMAPEDEARYHELLHKAVSHAHNIVLTEGAYWSPPLPLSNYDDAAGSLTTPAQWPSYRINKNVSVASGSKTKQSGIYVPNINHSCPQFLSSAKRVAPPASVLAGYEDNFHPITGEKSGQHPIFKEESCMWYLVERQPETAEQSPPAGHFADALRVHGGQPCPEAGFYFTPANPESRRRFHKGELMPLLSSEYGATIWQWDSQQS